MSSSLLPGIITLLGASRPSLPGRPSSCSGLSFRQRRSAHADSAPPAEPLPCPRKRHIPWRFPMARRRSSQTIGFKFSDNESRAPVAQRRSLEPPGSRSPQRNQSSPRDARAPKRHLADEAASCPTCGRTQFDVKKFLKKANPFFKQLEAKGRNITIAVMGCPVNGPGEARNADFGITGTEKYAIIFKQGELIKRISTKNAFEAFKEEILKNNESS